MTAEGSPKRAWLLVLAYLPALCIVALLVSRDRKARWHARNGLLLFGVVLVTGIAATVVGILFPAMSCLYAVAMLIVSSMYVGIVILAIVKAIQGQRLMIPGLSPYASRLSAKD